LEDIDKIIGSSVKEMCCLPNDFPNSTIYSSTMKKGIGLIRAKWEGPIQIFNMTNTLKVSRNKYVEELCNLDENAKKCLSRLNINEEYENLDKTNLKIKELPRKIRDILRQKEYGDWCKLPCHGKGVELFQDCEKINSKLFSKNGLSTSEWINYLKLIPNVAPSRSIPGRSQDGTHCRRCSEKNETLAHILGFCQFGLLLRNKRHHFIRSLIAEQLRQLKMEVYEEIHVNGFNDSNRRTDIFAIDRKKQVGLDLS